MNLQVLLNNCMKKKNTLTPKQREIMRGQTQNDWQREKWQKQNGFNDKTFVTLPLILVQAQMIATNILKAGSGYLDQNQAATLNKYLRALCNKGQRDKLKEADAYKVMNIGKQVNRKMFKAHKAIN